MDLSRVRKKLEEAGFFLGKMSEQEQRLTGHRVPFDYYLSAFLSTGRTVDYRLCHEHKAIYKPWRKAWNARITPDENRLMSARITSSYWLRVQLPGRVSVPGRTATPPRPQSGRSQLKIFLLPLIAAFLKTTLFVFRFG